MQITENSDSREFMCPCCKTKGVKTSFVKMLQEMRSIYGKSMKITSGYRCPAHNKSVGGVDTSSHLSGYAADIACESSKDRYMMVDAAIAVGFKRIGVAKNFIHLDTDHSKPPSVMWLY